MVVSPAIPARVQDVSVLYFNCHKLTTAAQIGHLTSVNAVSTFKECHSLVTYLGAPEGTADGDFSKYALPKSVKNMRSMFSGCRSITTAPIIPISATNMYCAFSDCDKLTGVVTINANPTDYKFVFASDTNCPDLILTGKSKILNKIAQAENNARNIYDINGNKIN